MTFALTSGVIAKHAEISSCGRYRYWLAREWDAAAQRLTIIMLNPSTADAEVDDRTIGRCMEFARRDGFGGINVINLFAFRTSSPAEMKAAPDPVGPDNDMWLIRALKAASGTGKPIMAAWGVHGEHRARAAYVQGMAQLHGARLVCLGTTRAGHPKHPLYVRGDQLFIPFGDLL